MSWLRTEADHRKLAGGGRGRGGAGGGHPVDFGWQKIWALGPAKASGNCEGMGKMGNVEVFARNLGLGQLFPKFVDPSSLWNFALRTSQSERQNKF